MRRGNIRRMPELLYGRQPVLETLRAGRRQVRRVVLRRGSKPSPEMETIARLSTEAGIPLEQADGPWFLRLGNDVNHQGAAADVEAYPYATFDTLFGALTTRREPAFLLLLDHIQDPQNLGSILRSADAAGAHGVILPADRAAHVTPAVVRASAGAAEHVAVAIVTNLARTMRTLKDEAVFLYGLECVPGAPAYTSVDYRGAIGLVIGGEGEGLGRLVRETCDGLVAIPLCGKVGSLNAGVATAVALYEARRQRGLSAA
jgi:23S rRNA (guanosine2251-2'-O)-methyltransferase